MGGSKRMGAIGMAAALVCAGAPAQAGDEEYQGHAVSVCRTIPHYPNAQSYDPFDSSFDSRSAHTRTTDDWRLVVAWFQANLGPGWRYRAPARDEWPQTHVFYGPGDWVVEIRLDVYPIGIVFSCNGG